MKEKRFNRLKHEKSPYLLQHASNPVDWYPWCDEAFERAKAEDRPVFLSIGYSTCHWCHVMERESFEDDEVARLMNETFVSIKVDREERPDLDNLYMTVCQMMTGSGGWPLTIIMTPDKEPFFAGTYFPRTTVFGRIGMMELIPRIKEIWRERRSDIAAITGEIIDTLNRIEQDTSRERLDKTTLDKAFEELRERFDHIYGGFGTAPKFPTPHNLYFLLRYWKKTKNHDALDMVEKTLLAMKAGGIYDHIGFGFHRYSTDRRWLVPHFEKMLYDQALIAIAYTEAYQATGRDIYRETAEEILLYVLRDMQSEDGGFYTAEDADSEGEEGRFYLWEEQEIDEVFNKEDARLVKMLFNIEKEGNFKDESSKIRTGRNILYLGSPIEEKALSMDIPERELREFYNRARRQLFEVRRNRIHPLKDDKILTDWNGLMIASLSIGGRTFHKELYTDAATKAARFILDRMGGEDGRLLHRYRDGESAISSNLDDYVFLIWGLIELYETCFEPFYLKEALRLNEIVLKDFWDGYRGGFYFTPEGRRDIISRQKTIYDGATPSGNSVAMMNLIRLGYITGDQRLTDMAHGIATAFSTQIMGAPSLYTYLMSALELASGESYQIVITGRRGAEDTDAMIDAIRDGFKPELVLLFKPDGEDDGLSELAKYTSDMISIGGRATAYLCRGNTCTRPTTDIKEILDSTG